MGEDMNTKPVSFPPQVYSRKDIDDAYNRGFNDANLGERQISDEQDYTCPMVCCTCASCNRGTPYATYCIWCGKPFKKKRKRGDTQ